MRRLLAAGVCAVLTAWGIHADTVPVAAAFAAQLGGDGEGFNLALIALGFAGLVGARRRQA